MSAALLHETIRTQGVEETEIVSLFGENIGRLVSEVTKINKLSLSADSVYQINYYKKILVGLCEDVRVIIIKLADRVHNMKTLWAIPEEKQKEKSCISEESAESLKYGTGNGGSSDTAGGGRYPKLRSDTEEGRAAEADGRSAGAAGEGETEGGGNRRICL